MLGESLAVSFMASWVEEAFDYKLLQRKYYIVVQNPCARNEKKKVHYPHFY